MRQKCFKTPRLLKSDAYTVSGYKLESNEAIRNSMYYITFRRFPHSDLNFIPSNDNRIIFSGLQRILDRLFSNPITHNEILESKEFLKSKKVGTKGFSDYEFPEHLWTRVVDEFEGHLPIRIDAVPEGSVVYPNEPIIRVYNTIDGFGPLASWFEAAIMRMWAVTGRITGNRHWLEYNKKMIQGLDSTLSDDAAYFLASIMMHDFSARAASCEQEAEDLGMAHLYCFGGTDTFEGAFQAWRNGAAQHVGSSVWALAHRIVQAYKNEGDCYTNMYDKSSHDSLLSMVADCYNYRNAIEKYLIPLALRSQKDSTGRVIVARPDSAPTFEDEVKDILWTLDTAVKNGLYQDINGYRHMTTLRLIIGNSMTFEKMQIINNTLIAHGYAPHGCLIYGVGGHLRNSITRDDMSTKYALCGYGDAFSIPCIKLSEEIGKSTLPYVKVLRTAEALESGTTIVNMNNNSPDSLVNYYNGINKDGEWGVGMEDNFPIIQERILKGFNTMPLNAGLVDIETQQFCDKIREIYRGISNAG